MSKSVSGYFKTKKEQTKSSYMPLSRGGEGVKVLVALPLKKDFFYGFPNSLDKKHY